MNEVANAVYASPITMFVGGVLFILLGAFLWGETEGGHDPGGYVVLAFGAISAVLLGIFCIVVGVTGAGVN